MLLGNGLSTIPNKNNPIFSNGPKSLPKYCPDYPILCNWVFDNFTLPDESFAKSLQTIENLPVY